MKLDQILEEEVNLASSLDKDTLSEIGELVVEHYETDRESRKDWESSYEKWLDMANQKIEEKTRPWRGAANIKLPLVTNAAMQFNARVVPALMPNNEPVGAGAIGPDPDGQKAIVASKIAGHMNHQLITEMGEWEEEFDKLLMSLPIVGLSFKKTYYNPLKRRLVSEFISPDKLVVNYYATNLESTRKTQIHESWTKNDIQERVNAGLFEEVEWEGQSLQNAGSQTDIAKANAMRLGLNEPGKEDSSTPIVVLEYHGFYDLDEDGYEEPYIITVLEDTKQVLQMTPRFGADSVTLNEDNEVVRIEPYESYTKYSFIPNPDGSFYDLGFGHLLYPLNATANTAINQLLDSGTLANMQSGFLGRGIQMKGGMFSMGPGRWTNVNTTGDDLRKGIIPLPTKEPSKVIFALLEYIMDQGQRLSATTDIFTGEHPGQNTKAGVTATVREEGQKVFTAIYKRIRRALKNELDKIYEYNGIVLASAEAGISQIGNSAEMFGVTADMYDKKQFNIQPTADPNIAVKEQKLSKDMTVLQLMEQTGLGNKTAAVRRILTTLEVENLDELVPADAQPPQDPKAAIEQTKMQLEEMKLKIDAQNKAASLELDKEELNVNTKLEILKVGAQQDIAGMNVGAKVAQLEQQLEVERQRADAGNNNSGER